MAGTTIATVGTDDDRRRDMAVSRKALCAVYALFGALAFAGSWGNVLGLVKEQGFWAGTIRFWQDTLVNGSSRFITVDLLFLGLTVIVWMVLEARRLRMPGVWLYVVGGLLIAISLTVPLFMIQRERRLAALEPGAPAGALRAGDAVGLVLLAVVCATYAAVALTR
jgi:Terpene cyclase DEP1